LLWVAPAESKPSQDIAFGEDAGYAAFTVEDANGADMVIKHSVDSFGDGCIEVNGCGFWIAEFEDVHEDLHRHSQPGFENVAPLEIWVL